MKSIVSAAFDFIGEDNFDAEELVQQFNEFLARDGFRIVTVDDHSCLEGETGVRLNPRFQVRLLG